ncbi:hypothetical protein D4Q76_01565, partial [archaeon]
MKGQTELSEFMLKLIATMLFTVFLIGGILAISQFKVQINSNSGERVAIDFGENVLAAPCLTEKKGLFLESKINNEAVYRVTHMEDKDGISCMSASLLTAAKIKTEKDEWFFGSSRLKSDLEASEFVFPAVLKFDGFSGDDFESGLDILDILDPAKTSMWIFTTSGVSLSSDFSRSLSHSLKIDGSAKCTAPLIGETGCGVKSVLPNEKTGAISVWFYDQNPSENSEMFAGTGKDSDNFFAIGPDNPSDAGGGKYFYQDSSGYHETSIARSAGWHEFKWIFDGSKVQGFIDGAKFYETSGYGTFLEISLKSKKSGGMDGYFDDVKIESSGIIVPAKLFVVISATNNCNSKNEGLNCYNCLEQPSCEKQGCRWDTGIC